MRYYEHRTTNLDFMDDTVIPSSVKYWSTPIGKKEVKLIEKTLEDLGKIKLEIYDVKGKKIETLYIKYKK
jgi:adenine C2-methylase RlmN of 23S rRNA A2503 and tRNA A37